MRSRFGNHLQAPRRPDAYEVIHSRSRQVCLSRHRRELTEGPLRFASLNFKWSPPVAKAHRFRGNCSQYVVLGVLNLQCRFWVSTLSLSKWLRCIRVLPADVQRNPFALTEVATIHRQPPPNPSTRLPPLGRQPPP